MRDRLNDISCLYKHISAWFLWLILALSALQQSDFAIPGIPAGVVTVLSALGLAGKVYRQAPKP